MSGGTFAKPDVVKQDAPQDPASDNDDYEKGFFELTHLESVRQGDFTTRR
jgi:hypothetical protein